VTTGGVAAHFIRRVVDALSSTCLCDKECLAYALADSELTGVWGGTTTQERKRLRKAA
jgi:Transcription factor WhiB